MFSITYSPSLNHSITNGTLCYTVAKLSFDSLKPHDIHTSTCACCTYYLTIQQIPFYLPATRYLLLVTCVSYDVSYNVAMLLTIATVTETVAAIVIKLSE